MSLSLFFPSLSLSLSLLLFLSVGLSICMFVCLSVCLSIYLFPVQDGGPGGRVFVSSGLQFYFGQSPVVAAVVNAERVYSVGLKFVLHKYANFISRMFPTREIVWIVSLSGQFRSVFLLVAIKIGDRCDLLRLSYVISFKDRDKPNEHFLSNFIKGNICYSFVYTHLKPSPDLYFRQCEIYF